MNPDREPGPERLPLRNQLAWRLALAMGLGVAAVWLVAAWWNIRLQRTHMIGLVQASAERRADTIRRSTREAMLRNQPEEVHGILASIGAQEGVERIRIFDKEGRIKTSTDQAEVDHVVDKQAEQCFGCHAADQPLTRLDRPDRIRFFDAPGGQRVLGIIAPIQNEPDCTRTCHDGATSFQAHSLEQQVLGVLDLQLSLDRVDEQLLASERQLGIGLLVTMIAAILTVGLFSWRIVLKPVRQLTSAAHRVRSGDLSVRVQIQRNDEIGMMADSWNAMLDELGQARKDLEEWSHTLEARVEEKSSELEQAHRRMIVVEKMASLGKLAAVVAHEINNPLAGINTYARLLGKKLEADAAESPEVAETARIIRMMEDEAARCGKIVRNLLLFSRTPGARFTLQVLPPLLERCILLVKHKADLQEIDIKLDVDLELPAIVCDESQLQQLFLVLIMNAVEAMPEGGVLTVKAQVPTKDERIMILISDTGVGIPQENLNQIFEPFFTTKEQGQGVGLGLAVAYGIVERHGGTIDVRSTPGSGTTFTVHLPREQPEKPEEETDIVQEILS